MTLRLIIGNKNYSSWSFRPWLAMKVANIAFEEEVISLDAADFQARMAMVSGAGKVPVLIDGDVCSGIRSQSWNIWPKRFPLRSYGRPMPLPAAMPERSLRRCMLASPRCADIFP